MNRKLNVLLIRPPFSQSLPRFEGSIEGCVPEPLGLTYIAASILNKFSDVEVRILDAGIKNLNLNQIMNEISSNDFNIIGFSYLTPQAKISYRITQAIKDYNPELKVVHGGIHATLFPYETLQNGADFCILGEGEETFAELLEYIFLDRPFDNVRGLSFRENGKIINNPPRPLISNLDNLPFPARQLINIDNYFLHTIHAVEGIAVSIMASRGCPYSCNYCVSPLFWGRKVRFRSAESVLSEIEQVINLFGIKLFHFYDDNFTLNENFVKEFCKRVIQKKLDIKWVFLDRTKHIYQKAYLLEIMKEAGCVGIELGVEDSSEEVLANVNKPQSMSELISVMSYLNKLGIMPIEEIMTFNPGETIASHYQRWELFSKFYRRKGLFLGQFATPYPETEFDRSASRLGIRLVENYEDRVTRRINFVPNSLLNDVPLKLYKKLPDEITFQIVKYILVRYRELPKIRTAFLHSLLLKFTYDNCNGNFTVRKLIETLFQRFKLNFNSCIRFVAFNIVIFAQMGIVNSKKSNIDTRIHDVFPPLTLKEKFYARILGVVADVFFLILHFSRKDVETILTKIFGRD